MPISKYFKGKGTRVLRAMRKRYGKKAGTRVFYATANKQTARRKSTKATRKTASRRK